jgi:DNA mismatch endonuclease (patch repair protein)
MASTPKTDTDKWEAKFARNIQRDADNIRALIEQGWRVEIIWECESESDEMLHARLQHIFGQRH